jgi:AcrR family transcriptional regulator
MHMSQQPVEGAGSNSAPLEGGRVARNRRRRAQAFLAAGLRIVTDEGIDALTMARLADELDTAVGSVYRYFSSKSELVAAIQAGAIEQLQESHDRSVGPMVAAVSAEVDEPESLLRLVVLGRWICGAAQQYPEEVRLLQMVSSRRASSLTESGAAGLVPATMTLVAAVGGTIEEAMQNGVLRPGDSLARAIVWLTAFGGVFVADDLEQYVPDVLGGGRLVRRLNTDLLAGWGVDPATIERVDAAIDAVDGSPPLVQ